MRTIVSKINLRVLLSAVMAATFFLAAGCRPQEKEKSEIILSEENIEVNSSGGQFTVTYEFRGSADELTAEPSASWINGIDLSGKGIIRFNVDRNGGDGDRTATLELSVPSVSDPAVLTVVQKASQPFEVQISNVSETGIDFKVVPEDDGMTYVATIVDKERFDRIGGKDKYFENIVNFYRSEAEKYEMTVEEFLEKSEALVKGEQTLNIRNLSTGTGYVIVVFGMDLDCTLLSRIVVEEFTTKTAEKLDITFDISYEITGNRVMMSVTPSDDKVFYYFNIIKKSDADVSGKDFENDLQAMISSFISNGTSVGMTVSEVISEICSKGKAEYDYKSIDPLTDFLGYAFAVSESGLICSEVVSEPFRTGDVNPSENRISLVVENVSSDRADISVVTTNTDPYVLIIDKASNWEPFVTDQEKIDELFSGRNLEKYVRNGNADGTIKDLVPETDYIVMAIGYFYGKPTTGLVKAEFRTLREETADQMTFEFTVDNVTSFGADVTVKGNPASTAYYWGVVEEAMSVDDVNEQTDRMVEYYLSLGYGRNRAEVMRIFVKKSMSFNQFNELSPETAYKVFACEVDESTGEFKGEMVFSDAFMTEKAVIADVKATVEFGKYYDCYELSQLDPSFPPAKGIAVVPLSLKIEGNAAGYYYYAFEQDMTDLSEYPDSKVINELKAYGISDETSFDYQSFYDTDLTVVAVAYDAEGNYGPVFREKIYVTKENASPAEEYVSSGK